MPTIEGPSGPTTYPCQLVEIGKLRPDPRNARAHSKLQVLQLGACMDEFGFTNPILADEEWLVIAGHGRLLAAKERGFTEVPVIVISGLTDLQKRRLRLADNKLGLNSSWDKDLLQLELKELSIEIPDLEIPGFGVGEIDAIVLEPAAAEDDVVPPIPATAVTQAGDIWRLGPHRIACGDCRDEALMAALLQGRLIDAAVQDAPYNVRVNGHAGGMGKVKHREFAFASGEMSPAEFVTFLRETLGAGAKVSRNGAVHFLWMDHHHADELIEACRDIYDVRLNICVWNKSNAGMGSLYRSKHELIFVYRVGGAQHFNAVELGKHGRSRSNVWDGASVNTFGGSRPDDLKAHPTVKPHRLVADAIMDVTRRGDAVLDSFLGSGTTLIACERTGRVCFGIEIDPLYVDVAIERYFLMTSEHAVLEETGERFDEVRARRAADGGEG